jgi:hypothetical protein
MAWTERAARLPSEPMRTATKLAGLELSDWRGEVVRLGSLWAERPVVLLFIRHFG